MDNYQMAQVNSRKVGLALGSGAARGWAHVGVLQALTEMGVRPDIVAGTSVGALVGGAFLTGQLDDLRSWSKTIGLMGLLKMVDITFSRGGLVAVEKAFEMFRNSSTDVLIEHLPVTFATVATDLATGREIWLRRGPLLDMVRASAAMPGLFPAVRLNDAWLVDGALVNPVPVSVCRALGADVVIAVNLNGDISILPRLSQRHREMVPVAPTAESIPPDAGPPLAFAEGKADGPFAQMLAKLGAGVGSRARQLMAQPREEKVPVPSVMEIMAGSIDIMQDRITRSRLAGEPPDVLIQPRLGQIGILDFEKSEELIALGLAAGRAMRPAIELALDR
jgi:NTE family protein